MRPEVMKRSIKYSTEDSKIGSKNSKTLWPSDIKDFEGKCSGCEWSERSSLHSSISVWSQLFFKNRMHIREWTDNCQKLSILRFGIMGDYFSQHSMRRLISSDSHLLWLLSFEKHAFHTCNFVCVRLNGILPHWAVNFEDRLSIFSASTSHGACHRVDVQ